MKYIILGLTGFAIIVISLIALEHYLNTDFRAWRAKCATDGGITVMTREGYSSNHWECLKDGQIINHVED